MGFTRFMATTAGRLVRLFAGVLLVVIGLVAGGGWFVLAIVGVVPLLAAAFDVCGFAPLFGQPFHGRDIRAKDGRRQQLDHG
jgi:hypothetical protein